MFTHIVFTVLGPFFLVLGTRAWLQAGSMVPKARAWIILGVCFSVVAAWLWWNSPGAP
jgi:hypothetical protein